MITEAQLFAQLCSQLLRAVSIATGISEYQLAHNSKFRSEVESRSESETLFDDLVEFVKDNTHQGGLFVRDRGAALMH